MTDLKLFFSPRACSLACHIALEESGLDYEAVPVRIRMGEHKESTYKKMNPWGKIPTLLAGDKVLTETHAILSYIADTASVELIPRNDPLSRARAHEWMNFLSSTVHIAFRPLFRPNLLVDTEELYSELLKVGIPNLKNTLMEVERRLTGKKWALGDTYSVCDAYIFVFHIWSQREDVVEHVDDMPNWMAHRKRMEAREATQIALNAEGVTVENITDK
ncbi:MAG: glutathione S-transferase N-terminal domain-containing protein [Pseudomonadota bacterium]|nr:glutathione S-transferase N-terminal domain-containing protein [Pseudomonadota bacterium]